ncbi:MAG: hypothetical protein ACOYJD_08145 [Christensenellales bacterium]|jgi:hypothetical protein
MRNSKGRFFLKILLFLVIFVLAASMLGFALTPAESFTRLMLNDMYNQNGGIQVALVGASHALYGFDTHVIDAELDTNCFNLGSASQKAIDAYYLLKEMYRNDNKPELVVIELTYAMYTKFSGYDNPTSSMILYDYYRPGVNKLEYLGAAFDTSDYANLFLKAYRYRSRFPEIIRTLEKKLTAEYLAYDPAFSSYNDESYVSKGFVFHEGGFKQGGMGRVTPYKWDEKNLNADELGYLDRIIELCRSEGSEVVLISTPLPMATLLTLGNYSNVHTYFAAIAKKHGAQYFDFNLVRAELYARPDTDYFDTNHLNGHGAAAFSTALSKVLAQYCAGENMTNWFYSDYGSMERDYNRIANVYLQTKKDNGSVILTAKAYYGSGVSPEYRFSYRKAVTGEYIVFQDYSAEVTAVLALDGLTAIDVRVEARAKGGADVVYSYATIE